MNAVELRRQRRARLARAAGRFVDARAFRRRRGVALLIVLALLGLFAAVGVSFAVLSRSESRSARNFVRSVEQPAANGTPVDVNLLFANVVNQLLYDTDLATSSLRGHSFLRDMYGGPASSASSGDGAEFRDKFTAGGTNPVADNRHFVPARNLVTTGTGMTAVTTGRIPYFGAYNGTGMFRPRRTRDPASAAGASIANGALHADETATALLMPTPPRDFGPISIQYNGNQNVRFGPLLPYNFREYAAGGALRPGAQPFGTPIVGQSPDGATNYTWNLGHRPRPEEFVAFDTSASASGGRHYFPFDEDYDAANHDNMFLGLERADGTVIQPSFHRPYLIRQLEQYGTFGDASAETKPSPYLPENDYRFPAYHPRDTILTFANYDNDNLALSNYQRSGTTPPAVALSGRRMVLRPRLREYDRETVLATGNPSRFPAFLDKNNSGFIGDDPSELDVDTDGDGKKDAIWIDAGLPRVTLPGGVEVKPLVAIKVLGLDGKINLNIAGNFLRQQGVAATAQRQTYDGRPEGHVSSTGSSPALVNPLYGLLLNDRYVPPNSGSNIYWTPKPTGLGAMHSGNEDANHAWATLHNWPSAIEQGTAFAPGASVYNAGHFVDPLYLRWIDDGLPTVWPPTVATAERGRNGGAAATVFGPNADVSLSPIPMSAPANANLDTAGGEIVRPQAGSPLGPVNHRGFGRAYSAFSGKSKALWIAAGKAAADAETETRRRFMRAAVDHELGIVAGALGADASGVLPMGFVFDQQFSELGPIGTANGWLAPQRPNQFWHAHPEAMTPLEYDTAVANLRTLMREFRTGLHRGAAHLDADQRADQTPFDWPAFEALWHLQDLNASALDPRLPTLLQGQFGPESVQPEYSQYRDWKFAARERMRKLFTAGSQDIGRYSNPPTFGDALEPAGALPATATDAANGSVRNDEAAFGTVLTPNTIVNLRGVSAAPPVVRHNGAWAFPGLTNGTGTNALTPFDSGTNWWKTEINAAASIADVQTYLGSRFPQEVLAGRRFDLTRPLTSYETHPLLADAERTAMATQLYLLLCCTAGLNSRPLPANAAEVNEAVAQARTLAQLAVNIVDYLDGDSVMTTMTFHPLPFKLDPVPAAAPAPASSVAAEWDLMDALANAAVGVPVRIAGGGALTPALTVSRAEFTVMGFELPDLVIGEGVSVTQPLPNPAPPNQQASYVFAELWNPWPAGADLDARGQPRGTLVDSAAASGPAGKIRTATPQSRFLLGVRQQRTGGTPNYQSPAKFLAAANFGDLDDHFVDFTTGDGAFSLPRAADPAAMPAPLPIRPVVRGGQRLLVEPERFSMLPAAAVSPDDPVDWLGASLSGGATKWQSATESPAANRYTSAAGTLTKNDAAARLRNGDMRLVFPAAETGGNVAITLYRVRNPYLPVNEDGTALGAGALFPHNPYIAIDTLALKQSTDPATEKTGAYTYATIPAATAGLDFNKSVERRQPWVGCAVPWAPYHGLTGILQAQRVYQPSATNVERFLEGKFLGHPYLIANAHRPGSAGSPAGSLGDIIPAPMPYAQTAAAAAAQPPFPAASAWASHLRTNGFAEVLSARNHTLFLDANDNTNDQAHNDGTANTRDLAAQGGRYLHFPFANRELASPMELLSVRLYGAAMWKVPQSADIAPSTAPIGTTPRAAASEVEAEWRMRFTDDFEFSADGAYTQQADGTQYPSPKPGVTPAAGDTDFNRVYRSREVPWFLGDRRLHPMDPNNRGLSTGTLGHRETISGLMLEAYLPDPQTIPAGTGTADALRHSLAPFPNLHRFFEFVECSRQLQEGITTGGANNDPAYLAGHDPLRPHGWSRYAGIAGTPLGPPGSVAVADGRAWRVPGKINLNLIADEEVFKALLDDESALPWTPTGTGTFAYSTQAGLSNAAAWNDGTYFRPLRTPTEVSETNLGAQGIGLPVKALAWRPDRNMAGPYGVLAGGASELVMSFSNDTSVGYNLGTVAAPNVIPIDFGGGVSSAADAAIGMLPADLTTATGNAPLLNRQFPGIVNGFAGIGNTGTFAVGLPYPGWQRDQQVGSEFFRQFVLSVAGRDGVLGSADDKPFASLASAFLSDTVLRRRNYAYLDFPRDGRVGGTTPFYAGTVERQAAGTLLVGGSGALGASGEYINRLGGQWTPRLFDPTPNPFLAADIAGRADVAGATPAETEYWMLEQRRNELLTKIANTITVRSHVFGVWMSIGYFRYEGGTPEHPLLGEEVFSGTGEQRRPRLFMVVDRSVAEGFEASAPDAAVRDRYFQLGETRELDDHPMVKHMTLIE